MRRTDKVLFGSFHLRRFIHGLLAWPARNVSRGDLDPQSPVIEFVNRNDLLRAFIRKYPEFAGIQDELTKNLPSRQILNAEKWRALFA